MIGVERPEWLWALAVLPALAAVARLGRRSLTRRRWALALALRLGLAAALILALAEPTWSRAVDDLAVVFVVDRSASVGGSGEQQALDYVAAAMEARGPADRVAVVAFGAEAVVEEPLGEDTELHGFELRVDPHASDLAAGLRLGAALLPADRTRRLVLLSDGEETTGDAASQALLAHDADLVVAAVPIGERRAPEVLVEDLVAPPSVDEGAVYELRVVGHAERATSGVLRLYRNDQPVGAMPVDLPAGRSRTWSLRQQAGGPGLARFRAQLEVDPSADGRPENNVGLATVEVRGRPRVLLVDREPAQAQHLATVWEHAGLVVDVVEPGALPPDLGGLRAYAAVALANVPAYAIPRAGQDALERYVRDLGRGLVMIGGDESFGLGGWYRTPVEAALPVRMDLSDKARLPKLAMVLALDKSGSMGGGGADSKLGMAREAAIRTAELLSDRDSLGVVTFDAAASWVTPLAPLADRRDAVIGDLASIRPGGGTDIRPALEAAFRALRGSDAAVKHVVLLSDGIAGAPEDYRDLVVGAAAVPITLTTVAVGSDADQPLMKELARWGDGQFYSVVDRSAVPAIFTRETLLATKSFLVEDPFVPALAAPSDLTRGLGGASFPALGGYVTTEAKPRAVLAMEASDQDHRDPLLAHWHYGLGRAVAFTSDARARWARDWVGTPSYVQLWTQVGRWVVEGAADEGAVAEAAIRDGELVVRVDAVAPDGAFRNFLRGEARVVAPDLSVRALPLTQVGPGRYEGRTRVDQDGSWLAGVQLTDGDQVVAQLVTEAVLPYSPELRRRGGGEAVIAEVARAGGGGTPAPADVFARPETPRQVPRALWPGLVALAAALVVLDVASRRLGIGVDGAPLRDAAPAVPPASRWTEARAAASRAGSPSSPSAEPAAEAEPAPDAAPPPEVPADSYAGKLLAARRAARRKIDGP